MFFNEDHLRITAIRTNNGTTPVFDDQGKPVKKIVFAPKNKDTLKLFEDQNRRLPTHLKMKIEIIKAYKPVPVHEETKNEETEVLTLKNIELEDQIEDLKRQLAKALNGNGQAKEASVNGSSSNAEPEKQATADSKNKIK